jgi:hypothetical protein
MLITETPYTPSSNNKWRDERKAGTRRTTATTASSAGASHTGRGCERAPRAVLSAVRIGAR